MFVEASAEWFGDVEVGEAARGGGVGVGEVEVISRGGRTGEVDELVATTGVDEVDDVAKDGDEVDDEANFDIGLGGGLEGA